MSSVLRACPPRSVGRHGVLVCQILCNLGVDSQGLTATCESCGGSYAPVLVVREWRHAVLRDLKQAVDAEAALLESESSDCDAEAHATRGAAGSHADDSGDDAVASSDEEAHVVPDGQLPEADGGAPAAVPGAGTDDQATRRGKLQFVVPPSADEVTKRGTDHVLQVTFLSPPALRRQLEEVVTTHGEAALCQEDMVRTNPTVYWNLVWQCARNGLPLPIASSERRRGHSYSERVFVGWDGPGVVAHAQVRCTMLRGHATTVLTIFFAFAPETGARLGTGTERLPRV